MVFLSISFMQLIQQTVNYLPLLYIAMCLKILVMAQMIAKDQFFDQKDPAAKPNTAGTS